MTPELVFLGQAVLIAGMYLSMRRNWLPVRVTVIGGVAASAVLMALRLLVTEGTDAGRSVLIGVPLGAAIGLAVAAIAWYFVLQERSKSA
ncbi:MAG: hypothetical protein MUC99_04175 [Anaerolineae bacterium]|jgi:hypothetical protein|nr:hypothetical protein [Anaerolineae bacterium]